MYKEASKQKLRFTTAKGVLTVEQLWTLSLEELDTLAVALKAEYEESGKKSFLVTKSVKDKTAKLRFDIALDILTTKVEETEAARKKQEVKEHNQKIYEKIEQAQDKAMDGKTVKQLKAMLIEE